MFQLAAFTDEISQDFEHAVAVCGEYGVPAVEIRSAWQRKGPQDLLDDELTRMLDILGAARMTTACIASPFLKCDLGDAEAYQAHLGILRRCCEVARAMGTDIIRGFTFCVPDLVDAHARSSPSLRSRAGSSRVRACGLASRTSTRATWARVSS